VNYTPTDEALDMLKRAVIDLREVYEVPPKLRKAEVRQHERDGIAAR
jgi:hypothetical protein